MGMIKKCGGMAPGYPHEVGSDRSIFGRGLWVVVKEGVIQQEQKKVGSQEASNKK
jgi:hypothetical protein